MRRLNATNSCIVYSLILIPVWEWDHRHKGRDLSLIVKIGSLISTNLVTQALSFQEEMTI